MFRIIAIGLIINLFIISSFGKDIKSKKKKAIKLPSIELSDEPAVIINGKKITIGQVIELAIEKNHDIVSGKYDVAMADSMNEMFQKKYSPFIAASAGAKSGSRRPFSPARDGREIPRGRAGRGGGKVQGGRARGPVRKSGQGSRG